MNRALPAAIFGCAIALTATSHAFRTAEDTKEFEGAGAVAWPDATLRYTVSADTPTGMGLSEFQHEVVRAVLAWGDPACSNAQAISNGVSHANAAPGDGVNTVQWILRDWSGLGFSSSQPAVTDVTYELGGYGWAIVETDLYLNADGHDWVQAAGTDDALDLRSVLLHEVGHMFGLLHPCELRGDDAPKCDADGAHADAVMYPAYESGKVELSEDDIDGICYLYPRPACDENSCPADMECVDGACRETCGEQTCESGGVCFLGQCTDPDEICGEVLCDSTPECATDDDCGNRVCDAGRCVDGAGSLGDPCTRGRDCFTGACNELGFCATPCDSDEHCDTGSSCSDGECVPDSKRGLGESCRNADDCVGDQCVAELTPEPVCTRRCGEGDDTCPDGWGCSLVEDRAVCIPTEKVVFASGGGLSCRLSGNRSDGFEWQLLLGLAALRIARRARKGGSLLF